MSLMIILLGKTKNMAARAKIQMGAMKAQIYRNIPPWARALFSNIIL